MSGTDFLEKGRSGDGEGALIQPFNVTNWRGRTVTELMDKEKISREEAHARVDQTLEMWDRIAETGIDIHSMKVENLKNKSMFLEMETYVNKGFQKESLVEEMMNKTYFKMLNYY